MYYHVNFNEHCLVNNNISIPKKVINLYISYILNPWLRNFTYFTLKNCLFRSVKLTKNADQDKYKYSGQSIGFDSRWEFSITDGSIENNVIIFGADLSSCVNIDYKNKDILILSETATQGLDNSTLTAEAKYSIKFTQPWKRFALSLHLIQATFSYLLMLQKYYQSTLSNLHPNEYIQELHYYPFAVKLNRYVGSCNTLNDI